MLEGKGEMSTRSRWEGTEGKGGEGKEPLKHGLISCVLEGTYFTTLW